MLPECRAACVSRSAHLATPRTAVDLARRRAALVAERAYAYDEAATHYRRALEAARWLDPPDAHTALDLAIGLAYRAPHAR